VTDTYVDGPADLVVEVVSSESGARDRGEKFYEYEAAGIPEYWLVDPEREELAVYRLRKDRYRTAFEGHEGRAASEVLEGFWIEAEWLWQEELPAVLDVLRRWEVI
jgi:Uma2 family endonuclease